MLSKKELSRFWNYWLRDADFREKILMAAEINSKNAYFHKSKSDYDQLSDIDLNFLAYSDLNVNKDQIYCYLNHMLFGNQIYCYDNTKYNIFKERGTFCNQNKLVTLLLENFFIKPEKISNLNLQGSELDYADCFLRGVEGNRIYCSDDLKLFF